jgi:hypothetical protein
VGGRATIAAAAVVVLALAPEARADLAIGATVGPTLTLIGGADRDLAADKSVGVGYLFGARAARALNDRFALQVEPAYVRRRVSASSTTDIDGIDVPLALRAEGLGDQVRATALLGAGVGVLRSGSGSNGEGTVRVEVAGIDAFLEAGVGGRWRTSPTRVWTLDLRYRHGLRTIDPDDPAFDLRAHTLCLLVGSEYAP